MQIEQIIEYAGRHRDVNAMLITNAEDTIVYALIYDEESARIKTRSNILGKNIFDVYVNLSPETSSHCRVLRTGKPVIDETQLIVEKNGTSYVIITSTFPIVEDGRIVGTFDVSWDYKGHESTKSDKLEDREDRYAISNIVSVNREMLELKSKIRKVAQSDSPVLVVGESGTGKALVVESIHELSRRKDKPFISLNCAAVPDTLMESVLFGTVKGSFTGAENKKGIFEMANGGTLFLDELNSMSIDMQAKLLKAVEEQKYMKLGDDKYTNVNVRLVSAMNIEPQDAVKSRALRSDLLYRLSVVQLNIPPLRRRKDDIIPLVEHYIDFFNSRMNKNVIGISDDARDLLLANSWEGNVRELRNAVESAFNLSEKDVITADDFPSYLKNSVSEEKNSAEGDGFIDLPEVVNSYEKSLIINAISQSETLAEAAVRLGMTRQAIRYKIEKHRIDYKKILKR